MPTDPPINPSLPPPASFLEAAASYGLEFDPGDLDRLGRYLALLLEANKSFNLTAVRDPDEAWTRHVFDSLTLLPLLAELAEGARVIDVGSGGGLPGIPLAVTLPALSFTLLEATGKKAAFLRQTVGELGLRNIDVLQERAEGAGHDRGERSRGGRRGGHREAYDAAVARAVGRLATLAELCIPLVRVNGQVLLVKGQRAEEELAEARGALALLQTEHSGTIETPTGRIVVLTKRRTTAGEYPRRSGEPVSAPLGVGRKQA